MYQEFLGKKTGGHTDTGEGRRTKDEGRGAYLTTWEDMACDGQANSTHAIRMRWKRRSMGGRPAIN